MRDALGALERLLARAEAGSLENGSQLAHAAGRLLDMLSKHIEIEEALLVPTLRQIDAWGQQRVERLQTDHRAQRSELAHMRERLHRTRPCDMGTPVRSLARWLRRDMDEEERESLNADLLRDDLIAIDPFAG